MFDYQPITGFIKFALIDNPRITDDAIDEIYTDSAMNARFHLLENICLPSIKAQTDQDFKIVILSSACMPEAHKGGLLMLTKDNPNIVVDFSKYKTMRHILKPHQRAITTDYPRSQNIVNFNLGYDCAISQHYISKLRQISHNFPPSTIISFPNIIIMHQDNHGAIVIERAFSYCDQDNFASIIGFGSNITNRSLAKNPIWQRFPVVSDPSFAAYIKIQRPFNMNERSELQNKDGESPNIFKSNEAVERSLAENFPHLTQKTLHQIVLGL